MQTIAQLMNHPNERKFNGMKTSYRNIIRNEELGTKHKHNSLFQPFYYFPLNCRQKIDEPPTPYHVAGYESETESVPSAHESQHEIKHNWESLNAKLEYHESLQNINTNEQSKNQVSKIPNLPILPHVTLLPSSSTALTQELNEFGELSPRNELADESLQLNNQTSADVDIEIVNDAKETTIVNEPADANLDKFKEKRLAHYSEFKVLQALKNRNMYNDEDDENENDDDESPDNYNNILDDNDNARIQDLKMNSKLHRIKVDEADCVDTVAKQLLFWSIFTPAGFGSQTKISVNKSQSI